MPRRKNETAGTIVRSPGCPRCGYDLTGVVESWAESCPVEGVCSECGYAFAWADVLLINRQKLPWLFEHGRGISVTTATRTALAAVFPWWFWKRVQPHHHVSSLRLCLFPVVLVFGLYVISALAGLAALGVRAALFGQSATIMQSTWYESVGFLLTSPSGWVYFMPSGWVWSGYSFETQFAGVLIWLMSFGIMLSALISQSSFKNTPVRSAHLFRIVAYSVIPAMPASALLLCLWFCDRLVRHDFGGVYQHWFTGASPTRWDAIRVSLRGWVENPVASLFVPFVCINIWWFFALRTGLRVKDWWQILIAGIFLGPLVALAIVFIFTSVTGIFF